MGDKSIVAVNVRDDVGPKTTHLFPQKLILEDTDMMGDLSHLIFIEKYPPWNHIGVGIIQLVILVIFCLVLLLDMVWVVWFLLPPTFTPK